MSKARELASLGNAYSDGSLSNRNLIINGAMQVWQRGTSFTTGFTADRWVVGGASSATKVASSLAGFGSAIRIATSAGDPTFRQDIENYDGYLAGQTMTLSFWMKSDIANPLAVGQFCEWYDGSNSYNAMIVDSFVVIETSGDWKRYAHTFTLPSNATGYKFNARLDFNEETSQTVEITGVQLEVGDTATPFEHRSYGQELALAQRYFQKSASQSSALTSTSGMVYSRDGTASSVQRYIPVRFAQTMRTSPTVTIYDGAFTTGNLSQDTTDGKAAYTANIGDQSMMVYGPSGTSHYSTRFGFYLDAEL